MKMPCDVLDEYGISSVKRDVERSLNDISKVGGELESYKRNLDRTLRDIGSAFSSLERAIDERARELQRNAGKPSGYGSYSSAENNIKSERRKIESLLDRLESGGRELDDAQRLVKSAGKAVLPQLEKLQRSHLSLAKELERMTEVAKAADKKCSTSQDNERKLRSEIEVARRKVKLAEAAAIAAVADCDDGDSEVDADDRIAEIQEDCERKIAALADQYERRLASMTDDSVREKYEARIKRLSDMLEDKKRELAERDREFDVSKQELNHSTSQLDAERIKNRLLDSELSREKDRSENYRELLKKRTVAHLIERRCCLVKRFLIARWFTVSIVVLLFCLVILLLEMLFHN